MDKQALVSITASVDDYNVECDGASRLVHLFLNRKGVSHTCYCGHIEKINGDILFNPHFWTVAGDFIVDYRARMWLGPQAQHGVFLATDHPDIRYVGDPIVFGIEGCIIVEMFCKKAGVFADV